MQAIPPSALVNARIELHYASQVLSACADVWLPERADDGDTAMRWVGGQMVGEPINGVTLVLRPVDLAVLAVRDGSTEALTLANHTLSEAMKWADRQCGTPRGAQMRGYDMPASSLRSDGRFIGYEPENGELVRWFDMGFEALRTVAAPESLRIWPHHFDLGGFAGSIGIGFSLGDKYYAEPYFYVTPPADAPVRVLAGGGFWRTKDWAGAVLTASTIIAGGDAIAFLQSAI